MSSFEINCTVEGAAPDNLTHDCGTTKNLTWSANGTHSGLSFYLINSQLNNLIPRYIFAKPKSTKLLKFIFSSGSSTSAKVRIKYNVDGVLTIRDEYDLTSVTTGTVKYHELLIDSDIKSNVFIIIDVITSNGSSGSLTTTLDCDPQVISADFCYGFTNSNQYCQECPQTITFYKEKSPNSNVTGLTNTNTVNFSPYSDGPWFVDPYLQNEVAESIFYTYKVGDNTNRTYYTYNRTTHKFNLEGSCLGGKYTCGNDFIAQTNIVANYTKTNPYLPNVPNVKLNGLVYSIKEFIFELPTKNRMVPITVTTSGTKKDFAYIVTDAINGERIGDVSYGVGYNEPHYNAVTELNLFRNNNSVQYFTTTTGFVRVRVAIGQNKGFNGSNVTCSVRVGCGQEIYGYEMGVHPYSPYDAKNSPKVITTVWSTTPISSWSGTTISGTAITKGTYVFNDSILSNMALPWFYSTYNTAINQNTYQIGNTVNRSYGIKIDKKITKHGIFGTPNVSDIVTGPKDFSNVVMGTPRVPACIEPAIVGVGVINKILTNSDIKKPSVYSYLLGDGVKGAPGPFQDSANDGFFTFYDFAKSSRTPITGFEHLSDKLGIPYGRSTKNTNYNKLIQDGLGRGIALGGVTAATMMLVSIWGYPITIYFVYVIATVAFWVVAAAALVAFVWAIFSTSTKTLIEVCRQFNKKYTGENSPYIYTGTIIYNNDTLTSFRVGTTNSYCDGAYFYTIPSNATNGVVTTKELAYKVVNGVKTDTLNIFSSLDNSQEYITDFSRLFFLAYTAGYPEKYTTTPTEYTNAATSITIYQNSVTTGELNNSIPITYEIPAGTFVSTSSLNDANDEALKYLITLTGSTNDTIFSTEPKPGIENVNLSFTHDVKIENEPNLFLLHYNNDDSNGITINKKLYYDINGDNSVLNGYYSELVSGSYRKFYKTSAGVVVDVITWQNSGDTTATGSLGSYNISTSNLDYTSAWYITDYNLSDIGLSLYNNLDNLINDWNTSTFYSNSKIRRGFIKTKSTANSLYLYDSNSNLNSNSEAIENIYREVYPFESVPFTYYKSQMLFINTVEICDLDNDDNGLNFNVFDSNGNPSPSYFGITFTVNIYTGSTVLFATKTVTIEPNEKTKFIQLDIPYTGGTITSVDITSWDSPNPYNKTTFEQGSFAISAGVTPCEYYSGTTYIVDSYGYVQYDEYNPTTSNLTTIYSNVTEGIYTITQLIAYKSLKGSQDEVNYSPVANIRILETGDCYVVPTPTPTPTPTVTSTVTPTITPTNTVTPTNTPTNTVTPTITPTSSTVCEFGLSVVVLTPTPTPTVTSTVTPTITPTNTVTPTNTSTVTPTNTVTSTVTPTITPTNTVTPTITPTSSTVCEFGLSVVVLTPTPTPTATSTVTPTITPTNTVTPTNTSTVTPTNTVTPTVTSTVTPTITPTNTVTPTNTSTTTPTTTPTITPTNTPTITPTSSTVCEFGLSVVVLTPTPTPTPTITPTPSSPALTVSSTSTVQTCYNVSDASFTLTASGGNGASYEYSRDNTNWQASGTFSSLAGASYTGYARNSNRVGTVASVSVGNLARTAPNATFTITNVSCNGGANGSIEVTGGSGGSGTGYSTSIDNVTYFNLNKTFSSLTAATRSVYVKDSLGCVQSYSQTITQPTAQTATIPTVVNETASGNGSLTVTSTGGVWPKTYTIYRDITTTSYTDYDYANDTLVATFTDKVESTPSSTKTSLDCGNYYLRVVDANGCTTYSDHVEITCVGEGPTSVLVDNSFIFGTTATSTCPDTGVYSPVYMSQSDYDNRYTQLAVKFIVCYQDSSLTTPWSGYTFVYVDGFEGGIMEVYAINSTTGQIGNPTAINPC